MQVTELQILSVRSESERLVFACGQDAIFSTLEVRSVRIHNDEADLTRFQNHLVVVSRTTLILRPIFQSP